MAIYSSSHGVQPIKALIVQLGAGQDGHTWIGRTRSSRNKLAQATSAKGTEVFHQRKRQGSHSPPPSPHKKRFWNNWVNGRGKNGLDFHSTFYKKLTWHELWVLKSKLN